MNITDHTFLFLRGDDVANERLGVTEMWRVERCRIIYLDDFANRFRMSIFVLEAASIPLGPDP